MKRRLNSAAFVEYLWGCVYSHPHCDPHSFLFQSSHKSAQTKDSLEIVVGNRINQ